MEATAPVLGSGSAVLTLDSYNVIFSEDLEGVAERLDQALTAGDEPTICGLGHWSCPSP